MKFCTHCGAACGDELRFCPSCGASLASNAPESTPIPASERTPEPAFTTAPDAAAANSFVPPFDSAAQPSPKKKRALPWILGGCGAAVLILAAVVLCLLLRSPKSQLSGAAGKTGALLEDMLGHQETMVQFFKNLASCRDSFRISTEARVTVEETPIIFGFDTAMDRADQIAGGSISLHVQDVGAVSFDFYADENALQLSVPQLLENSYCLPYENFGPRFSAWCSEKLVADMPDDFRLDPWATADNQKKNLETLQTAYREWADSFEVKKDGTDDLPQGDSVVSCTQYIVSWDPEKADALLDAAEALFTSNLEDVSLDGIEDQHIIFSDIRDYFHNCGDQFSALTDPKGRLVKVEWGPDNEKAGIRFVGAKLWDRVELYSAAGTEYVISITEAEDASAAQNPVLTYTVSEAAYNDALFDVLSFSIDAGGSFQLLPSYMDTEAGFTGKLRALTDGSASLEVLIDDSLADVSIQLSAAVYPDPGEITAPAGTPVDLLDMDADGLNELIKEAQISILSDPELSNLLYFFIMN